MINQKTAQEAGVTIVDSQQVLTTEKQALIEQLKAILPNVINADNQLDIKALQDVVDISNTTSNNQGYELTFAGKGIARAMADKPCELELKTELTQSKNFDDTGNVVIRGDNLEVLKILQANYHKKIKMIYIDPPYNTKSENFIYKDNFKKSDEDLIENFELDEDSVDFLHNVYGTRSHSGWLSFIYPRLKLARDLLTDDGVIFISIDDNEQANLKILCDEIFGEDNFLCTFPRVTKKGGKSSNDLSKNHDNLLSYSKSKDSVLNSLFHIDKGFKNEDEFLEVRGKYKLNQTLDYDSIQYSKSLDYEIEIDGKIFRPGGVSKEKMLQRIKTSPKNDFCWRWSKKLFEFGLKNGFVVVKNRIYTKTYLNVKIEKQKDDYVIKHEERTKAISTIEFLDTKYSNDNAKKSLAKLKMGTIFDYPKGTEFLKKITKTGSNENDIILDFFAGSGTTADAVIQLNAEDGGNRKFVLVQIDEPIDEKKSAEAYQFCTDNQFKPIISSITIERLNRAGEKIKKDLSSKQGDLLDNKQCPDIGYKVFSCTPKPQVGGNGIFKVENNRNNVLDTLINMLVATCKTLDTKIECLIKNKLYQADNEIYLLANVDSKVLEKYQDVKINLDGWADIDLTQYLNLGIGQADNISVIY